jgi:hypothetical protein
MMALSRLSKGGARYTLLHLIDFCELRLRSILALALLWYWRDRTICNCISQRLWRGSFLHVDISSRFSEGRNKASHSSHQDSIHGNTTEDQRHSTLN